jgi:hypothetical protein
MEKGGERMGRAKKWKEGKIEGWGRRGRYGDGRDGRSPFTNPRYAIDCTAYTGSRMQHGL